MAAKAIFELIKILIDRLLGWPVMTFAIFLLLRHPLRKLLDRVLKLTVGKGGVEASFHVSQQSEAKLMEKGLTIVTGTGGEVAKPPSPIVDPVVQKLEGRIRDDMQKFGLKEESAQTTTVLVNHLAASQALYNAEFTYRTIFGSQIALLKKLNTEGPLPRSQLVAAYAAAARSFPSLEQRISVEQYQNYLVSMNLVVVEGDRILPTVESKRFLKWMVDAGVLENKLF